MTESSKRYYFEIHGLSECALPFIPLLKGGTIILDSTKFTEQQQCVRAAVSYLNKCRNNLSALNSAVDEAKCKTVVETNPFLTGISKEFSEDVLEYQKNRWSTDEIMKVYIASVEETHGDILFHVSIFQETFVDGFLYIPSKHSVN